MQNFAITKANLDVSRIDSRFLKYLSGWKLVETYKNNTVVIPDYVPFNYYAVYDKPGETENELQLSIWCGWASRSNGKDIDALYDAEAIINLRIEGTDVLLGNAGTVKAEILKSGGAPMQLYFNGKEITDFVVKVVFVPLTNGYQTVSDMSKFL